MQEFNLKCDKDARAIIIGSCQPICIKGESHRREKGNPNKRVFEQFFVMKDQNRRCG